MPALSTEQFLARLKQKGLLPRDLLAEVSDRARAEKAPPRNIVRYLVKAGHLSKYQGQELMADVERGEDAMPPPDDIPTLSAADMAGGPSLPALPTLTSQDQAGGGLLDAALMSAAMTGPVGAGPQAVLVPAGPHAGWQQPKQKGSVWESKLMLLGGGGLLLLIGLLVTLLFVVKGETGDQAYELAAEEYKNANYAAAIKAFENYLEGFPDHKDASTARVHLGIAQIFQRKESATDWQRALRDINETLTEIQQENDFVGARENLKELLPTIAEDLTMLLERAPNPEMLEQARYALAWTKDASYIPAKERPNQRIGLLEARLQRVEQSLARDLRLREAIAAIEQQVGAGETTAAYETRNNLLKTYRDLQAHPDLQAAILKASLAERDTVSFVEATLQPESQDRDSGMQTIPMFSTSGQERAPGVEGYVIVAVAQGAVYGLDAASGAVLWRRRTGSDLPPVRTSPAADADVLLVDQEHGELVCLAADGKLKWRLGVAGGIGYPPTVSENTAYLATGDNKVVLVDLASGASPGHFQLPQPLPAPPVVDRNGRFIYQIGSQLNLYVLDAQAGGQCRNVIFVGHGEGDILAPPELMGPYLVLGENFSEKLSNLLVFLLDEEGVSLVNETGEPAAGPLQSLRLEGKVVTSPVWEGRRFVATTDLGGVFVFDVVPRGAKEPFNRITYLAGNAKEPLVQRALLRDTRLWIANRELTGYEILASEGKLQAKWQKDTGSVFLQPLQLEQSVIFQVRRDNRSGGVLVKALAEGSGDSIWETNLASVPATGAVLDDQARMLRIASTSGGIFEMPLDGLAAQRGFLAITPKQFIGEGVPGAAALEPLSDGGWVLVAPGSRQHGALVWRPGGGAAPRWLTLPDAASALPSVFDKSLLVPGEIGQVFLLNLDSGQDAAQPFQARIGGGRRFNWAVEPGPQDALLSDGSGRVYRVGLSPAGDRLQELDSINLASPIISPLARLQSSCFGFDQRGRLIALGLPRLEPKREWDLFASPVWGPRRVGDRVLAVVELAPFDEVHMTSGEVLRVHPLNRRDMLTLSPKEPVVARRIDGQDFQATGGQIKQIRHFDDIVASGLASAQLICLDDEANLLWQAPLPAGFGAPCGDPLAMDQALLIASTTGSLWKINAANGEEFARVETGQPLVAGPLRINDQQIVLTGRDATLHVAAAP